MTMWLVFVLLGLSSVGSLYWYKATRTPRKDQDIAAVADAQGSRSDQLKVASIRVRQPWEYFLVLDVEATCLPSTDFTWPNEIIEWPVILLAWDDKDDEGRASQLRVVDEFRSFVQPTWRPILTEFCTTLTGISQKDVDAAPPFPEVMDEFHNFLCRHGLVCAKTGQRLRKFAWATDGPFDIRDFVVKQCFISKMKMPEWIRGDVIDVRKKVAAWLVATEKIPAKNPGKWFPGHSLNISRQLSALSLPPFQGRQHSGIDDTRNIARILTELGRRGVKIETNLRIHPNKRWYWMGDKLGEIVETYFER